MHKGLEAGQPPLGGIYVSRRPDGPQAVTHLCDDATLIGLHPHGKAAGVEFLPPIHERHQQRGVLLRLSRFTWGMGQELRIEVEDAASMVLYVGIDKAEQEILKPLVGDLGFIC